MRRWLRLLPLLACLGLPGAAWAQQTGCVLPDLNLNPVGFETVTAATAGAAVSLTAATVTGTVAAAAFVTLDGGSARFTLFGTPTLTVGHLIDPPSGGNAAPSRGLWICGRAALLGLRVIATGGTNAVLSVSYFTAR
jgi:hypothetical protein